ncbi:MAG: methyltransferase domain-containing protein [Blastocatellia bacterium]|nr:methyltransferase domain-containing protein [Blastocatellia bacterium]
MSSEPTEPYRPQTPMQKLRWTIAEAIGRERANRIVAPLYDWQAHRRTVRYLAALPSRDLQINLGCGYRPMDGWINVDRARGPKVQVVWDLERGLPFPDQCASAIFAEHVIEHVTKEAAQFLLEECHRVLQPEGALRLSTPDAGRFLRSYAGDQSFLHHPAFLRAIDSPMDRINEMMREEGQHLWSYDEELLTILLRRAGFARIEARAFGESAHPAMRGIDFEQRAFESLYLEGVKPASR